MTCITNHRSDTKTLQWGCSLYVGRALWDSFLRSELKVFVTSIFGLISDIPLALQLHSFHCTEQFLLWQTCPECLMLHVRWAFVASHPVPQWPQETCKGPSLVFVLVMQHGRHFHCVKYLPLNTTHISYHLIPCPGTQLITVTLWGSVHCYRFIVFWKLLEQTSFCSSEIFLFLSLSYLTCTLGQQLIIDYWWKVPITISQSLHLNYSSKPNKLFTILTDKKEPKITYVKEIHKKGYFVWAFQHKVMSVHVISKWSAAFMLVFPHATSSHSLEAFLAMRTWVSDLQTQSSDHQHHKN